VADLEYFIPDPDQASQIQDLDPKQNSIFKVRPDKNKI